MRTKWLSKTLIEGPHLSLCLTEKELKILYKECEIEKDTYSFPAPGCGYTLEVEAEGGGVITVVVLGDTAGMEEVEVLGLLVHEASHVVDAFFTYIQETKPSDEFKAYCLQSTAMKLIEEYNRKK